MLLVSWLCALITMTKLLILSFTWHRQIFSIVTLFSCENNCLQNYLGTTSHITLIIIFCTLLARSPAVLHHGLAPKGYEQSISFSESIATHWFLIFIVINNNNLLFTNVIARIACFWRIKTFAASPDTPV